MSEMEKKLLGGRYRIDALIGRGGMSDVYRGMDVVLQRQVAIKILTDRSEDLRKRFLREAQSMARLNHTNIVGVYDAAQNDGVSYIVMELVQGPNPGHDFAQRTDRPHRAALHPRTARSTRVRPREQRHPSRRQAGQHHGAGEAVPSR